MLQLASLASSLMVLTSTASVGGGQSIVQRGTAAGVPACASCHGAALQGDPSMKTPALAGLPAGFIVQRLQHYAGPTGRNAAMRQVASHLSPAEQEDVAAYLSGLAKPSP